MYIICTASSEDAEGFFRSFPQLQKASSEEAFRIFERLLQKKLSASSKEAFRFSEEAFRFVVKLRRKRKSRKTLRRATSFFKTCTVLKVIIYCHTKDSVCKVYSFLRKASKAKHAIDVYHASLSEHSNSLCPRSDQKQ